MNAKDRGIFILRVVLGFGWLFAGVHKFVSGDFTAAGFLKFATFGTWIDNANTAKPQQVINPLHSVFASMSGAPLIHVIDSLVVFGEIAVGLALILGIATRFSGLMGFVLGAMLALASWDFQNGFVNEQVLYAVASLAFAFTAAGAYALDNVLARLTITERVPALKYLVS